MAAGKQFEQNFKKALLACGCSIDRFYDSTSGFAGQANISDFVAYKFPFQYYFELKERQTTTLNFKSDITSTQWEGLKQKSFIPGVMAGVLVWFKEYQITAFVPIMELVYWRDEKHLKSLNVKDLQDNMIMHVNLTGRLKQKYYEYHGDSFIGRLSYFTKQRWNPEFMPGGVIDGIAEYKQWRIDCGYKFGRASEYSN